MKVWGIQYILTTLINPLFFRQSLTHRTTSIAAGIIPTDSDDNSIDTNATLSGYISVTPLTLNRTNMNVFEELKKVNREENEC